MSEAGLGFMYGPPEPYNLRALLRAGAVLVGFVQRHIRPLGPKVLGLSLGPGVGGRLIERLLRPRVSRLRLARLEERPDRRIDALFAAQAAAPETARQVLPVYDSAYYAWRFSRSPRRVQQPVLLLDGERPAGVAAVERESGRAALAGVVCPVEQRGQVYGGLLDLCRSADAVLLQAHVPARALELFLYGHGFLPRGRKPFQVQAVPGHPDRALLLSPGAWCYQWGDGDGDHVF
jgi:hypothetical protein